MGRIKLGQEGVGVGGHELIVCFDQLTRSSPHTLLPYYSYTLRISTIRMKLWLMSFFLLMVSMKGVYTSFLSMMPAITLRMPFMRPSTAAMPICEPSRRSAAVGEPPR